MESTMLLLRFACAEIGVEVQDLADALLALPTIAFPGALVCGLILRSSESKSGASDSSPALVSFPI